MQAQKPVQSGRGRRKGVVFEPQDRSAAPDRDRFRSAFEPTAPDAGHLWYFDFDGDGDVDGHDNGESNRRFGQY